MPRQIQLEQSKTAVAEIPYFSHEISATQAQAAKKIYCTATLGPRAPFMRRFAAVTVYDYMFCLWLATISVVTCRFLFGADGPRLTAHAPIQMLTLFVFLFRDSFFSGRGFGKGLLGLAVVDKRTKRPATLVQSLLRNLVFLAPYFLYQATALLLTACGPSLDQNFAQNLLSSLQTFGISYAILVVLVESLLMLRGNGLRLADRLSGTMVVKRKTQEQC
ncbi:MAG: RDD family protein [Candidatus Obscuribacterales bacterium]